MIFDQNNQLKQLYKSAPVTFINIIAVTIMFLVTIFTGGFGGENLLRWGALFTPSVYFNGEYYRLFTVMYLHGSVTHYIFNTMFGLFLISSSLERMIGSFKFAIIYFISGIGASLLIYVVYLITGTPSLGVGASGAIYGVLGAFLFLTFYRSEWFSPSDISSIRGLIIINVIFTILVPNVSLEAHLGGLVSGFLLIAILNPKRHYRKKHQGFNSPFESQYDPFDPNIDPFEALEEVTYVDDDDDDDDPWGRYS